MEAESLADAIELFSHIVNRFEEECVASTGLSGFTEGQIRYIDTIHHSPDPTVSGIAGHLAVTKASVSVALDLLEKRGVILKRPDEIDRRTIRIGLTDFGRHLAGLHDGIHRRLAEKISALLEPGETEQLMTILEKVNGRIGHEFSGDGYG